MATRTVWLSGTPERLINHAIQKTNFSGTVPRRKWQNCFSL